jgi:hypothetical protein
MIFFGRAGANSPQDFVQFGWPFIQLGVAELFCCVTYWTTSSFMDLSQSSWGILDGMDHNDSVLEDMRLSNCDDIKDQLNLIVNEVRF